MWINPIHGGVTSHLDSVSSLPNEALGNLMTDIRYMGILAKQALSKVSLAPYESSMPFHLDILAIILSTTAYMSSLLSLS
jgi:hypothetical protein